MQTSKLNPSEVIYEENPEKNIDIEYIQDETENEQLTSLKTLFEGKGKKENLKSKKISKDFTIALFLTILFIILLLPIGNSIIKKITLLPIVFPLKILIFFIITFLILKIFKQN